MVSKFAGRDETEAPPVRNGESAGEEAAIAGAGESATAGVAEERLTILGPRAGMESWARLELDGEMVGRQVAALRLRAGLTQVELGRRLSVSQPFVSQVEGGKSRAGVRFLRRVVEVCGDAVTVVESAAKPRPVLLPLNWPQDPRYCAGIDPDTLEFVRRGSKRDLELLSTFPRWQVWSHPESYAHLYDAAELAKALAALGELKVEPFREWEAASGDGSAEIAVGRDWNGGDRD